MQITTIAITILRVGIRFEAFDDETCMQISTVRESDGFDNLKRSLEWAARKDCPTVFVIHAENQFSVGFEVVHDDPRYAALTAWQMAGYEGVAAQPAI